MVGKSRKQTPKKKTVDKHAAHRLLTRFGIRLNQSEYNQIIKNIQAGQYKVHDRQSNRVTHYIAETQEQELILIYDHQRKQIVTAKYLDPDPILKSILNY